MSGDRFSPALRAARAGRRAAVIAAYREALRAAPPPPGVGAVILFGSWARGDFDGRSDVDLLLLTDVEGSSPTLDTLPVEPPADVVVLDRVTFDRRLAGGDPFPAEIARHGIRLWPE
jgi:hypothetical protein